MAEKFSPNELHDGPDPGDVDIYHDIIGEPRDPETSMSGIHVFPHVIRGEHVGWVTPPPYAEDVDGKFKDWPKIPTTKPEPPEQPSGSRPLSSAQKNRNGQNAEKEHLRKKATGEW